MFNMMFVIMKIALYPGKGIDPYMVVHHSNSVAIRSDFGGTVLLGLILP